MASVLLASDSVPAHDFRAQFPDDHHSDLLLCLLNRLDASARLDDIGAGLRFYGQHQVWQSGRGEEEAVCKLIKSKNSIETSSE